MVFALAGDSTTTTCFKRGLGAVGLRYSWRSHGPLEGAGQSALSHGLSIVRMGECFRNTVGIPGLRRDCDKACRRWRCCRRILCRHLRNSLLHLAFYPHPTTKAADVL